MKTISAGLTSSIASGKIANLIKITTRIGSPQTVYGYTDHDLEITTGGVTYTPAPGLQRIRLDATNDAKVGAQETGSAWVDVPEAEVAAGVLDEAEIEVMWVGWDNVGGSPEAETLTVFKGTLGVLEWTEEGFRADIQNVMRDLRTKLGTVYTPSCRHELGAGNLAGKVGGCTVNLSASPRTLSDTVASVVTQNKVFTFSEATSGTPPNDTGYYNGGKVVWKTGNNVGVTSQIITHAHSASTHTVTLFVPTPYSMQAGDTFDIIVGCDKTTTTCKARFNNIVEFGGFPFIKPEQQIKL
jgi:uncharacterized phage protein (TIGR02218 family)